MVLPSEMPTAVDQIHQPEVYLGCGKLGQVAWVPFEGRHQEATSLSCCSLHPVTQESCLQGFDVLPSYSCEWTSSAEHSMLLSINWDNYLKAQSTLLPFASFIPWDRNVWSQCTDWAGVGIVACPMNESKFEPRSFKSIIQLEVFIGLHPITRRLGPSNSGASHPSTRRRKKLSGTIPALNIEGSMLNL